MHLDCSCRGNTLAVRCRPDQAANGFSRFVFSFYAIWCYHPLSIPLVSS